MFYKYLFETKFYQNMISISFDKRKMSNPACGGGASIVQM